MAEYTSKNFILAKSFAHTVWTKRFNQHSSPSLVKGWHTLYNSFDQCIERNRNVGTTHKKAVVPLPTGSGKSHATRHYLRHLPSDVSALLVMRNIEDIDEALYSLLGGNSTEKKAIAYHSMNRVSTERLQGAQIVITTHQQLLKAMKDSSWNENFNRFDDRKRDLVIIDESLNQVESSSVSPSDIDTVITKIEQACATSVSTVDLKLFAKLKHEGQMLRDVKNLLTDQANSSNETVGNCIHPDLKSLLTSEHFRLSGFKSYLENSSFKKEFSRHDKTTDFDILQGIMSNFQQMHTLQTAYLYKSDNTVMLQGVEWLSFTDQSCVVLDATAPVDFSYKLHNDVEIINTPKDLRSYSNVILNISVDEYRLGKYSLGNPGLKHELIQAMVKVLHSIVKPSLEAAFEERRESVLIVVHNDVELGNLSSLQSALSHVEGNIIDVTLAHWGNLTGKNDYRDFNKLLILGLPYKPQTHITNLHVTTDRELGALGSSAIGVSKDIRDERQKIEMGLVTAEVIQAINRIVCRKVIDSKGNCPRAEVFLFRTGGKLGEVLLAGISQEMPDIKIVENLKMVLPHKLSKASANENRGRPTTDNDQAFINYIRTLGVGIPYKPVDIAMAVGISRKVKARIMKELESAKVNFDVDNSLHRLQKEYGIIIEGKTSGQKLIRTT